jgi:hypothetical protein
MRILRALTSGGIATFLLVAVAGPAWAHEGEEEVPAKTTVEEAILIIATQPEQMDAIDDKIGDAQEADDTDGVDLALVKKAGTSFEDGDLDTTLLLLEQSIGVQPGQMMTNPTSEEASPAPAPPSQEASDSPLLSEGAHRAAGGQAAGLLVLAFVSIAAGGLVVRRFR